jgi:ribosome maturation factor RimP
MAEVIEPIVVEELDRLEFDLVDLRRGGSRSRPVYEVRIDRRDGEKVSLSDCTRVSRALEARLESSASVGEQYVLEVSSPGADRPLRTIEEWRRFAGRRATVTSTLLTGGKQEVEILAVVDSEDGPGVELRESKGTVRVVPITAITQARLAFHWKR